MYEKLKGIVLNTVHYSDHTNIVRIFTSQRGLMAFAVAQGKTKATRLRNALLMPLSLIDIEARISAHRELATLRELRRNYVLSSIYSDPIKNAIALFMSELLACVIQEPEANTPLFNYVEQSVKRLDATVGHIGNFHICFLYHLGAHLGIQPFIESYHEGYWFDMQDGIFTSTVITAHPHLSPQEAQVIMLLSRMTFDNMGHFKFNHQQRNQMLDVMLNYYRLHNAALGKLRSPDILKQLFA